MSRILPSVAVLAMLVQAPAPMELSGDQNGRCSGHVFREDLQGSVPLARKPQGQGRRDVVQGAGRSDGRHAGEDSGA